MRISRRSFLRFCGATGATFGLSPRELLALDAVLRSPTGPQVLWLDGVACSGCSVSLLNHLGAAAPTDIADLLINYIDLEFHGTVMAAAGPTAVDAAYTTYETGNYILVVEGAVPTAFNGRTGWAWRYQGRDMTMLEAVQTFAARASKVICVGECSSFGGIPAAPPNPSGAMSVKAATGVTTINVAGCPPHPYWVVWVIAQLLVGNPIPVDTYGRPTQFFSSTVHSRCPLRSAGDASAWGQETRCKEELGCRGPSTYANCPNQFFNGAVNWCIGAGGPCMGCTQPTFPGTNQFFRWGD